MEGKSNKTDDPDYFKNYYAQRRVEKLEKQKEYNRKRQNEIREYQRKYNIKNREKKRDYYLQKRASIIPEKVPCMYCGKSYTKGYVNQHIKTKHLQNVSNENN